MRTTCSIDIRTRAVDMILVAVFLHKRYIFFHGIESKELSDEYDKDTIESLECVLRRGSEWLTLSMWIGC